MKPATLLKHLEATAADLSVKVSYETIAASVGTGGLCRVKGQYRIIIDKRTTPNERIVTLATALAKVGLKPRSSSGAVATTTNADAADRASGELGEAQELNVPAAVREVIAYYGVRRAS